MRHAAWLAGLLLALQAHAGESPATAEPQAASEPPAPSEPVAPAPVLLVEDLVPGVGQMAVPGMLVAVHYTGWLHDPGAPGGRGRQFDSSRNRNQPFVFPLGAGRVIKGWEQGVPGMQVGGQRRLVIPPGLAYGSRDIGNGLIPPGSTLLFEVELLGVETVSDTPVTE